MAEFVELSRFLLHRCFIPPAVAAAAKCDVEPAGLADSIAAVCQTISIPQPLFNQLIDALTDRGFVDSVRFRGKVYSTWHDAAIDYMDSLVVTVRAAMAMNRAHRGLDVDPAMRPGPSDVVACWHLLRENLEEFTQEDSQELVAGLRRERAIYEMKWPTGGPGQPSLETANGTGAPVIVVSIEPPQITIAGEAFALNTERMAMFLSNVVAANGESVSMTAAGVKTEQIQKLHAKVSGLLDSQPGDGTRLKPQYRVPPG